MISASRIPPTRRPSNRLRESASQTPKIVPRLATIAATSKLVITAAQSDASISLNQCSVKDVGKTLAIHSDANAERMTTTAGTAKSQSTVAPVRNRRIASQGMRGLATGVAPRSAARHAPVDHEHAQGRDEHHNRLGRRRLQIEIDGGSTVDRDRQSDE